MKYLGIGGGIGLVLLGVLLPPEFKLLRICLIAVGLALALFLWLKQVLEKNALVCPGCGARFTWRLPIALQQREGLWRCPRCGTMIPVQ